VQRYYIFLNYANISAILYIKVYKKKKNYLAAVLPFDLIRIYYAILFTKRASFDLRLAALFT